MMQSDTKNKLKAVVCKFVDELPTGKIGQQAAKKPKDAGYKPFHEALLPDNLINMFSFERSFSTTLGQGTFEQCAEIIACSNPEFREVERGKVVDAEIPKNTIAKIDKIVDNVGVGKLFSDYHDEVKRIIKFQESDKSASEGTTSVRSDLYTKKKNGKKFFFEIKSPKISKGQCLTIIRDHLKIHCIERRSFPRVSTWCGMGYNPYGEGNEYTHSFATKYLDVKRQVILGKEFWDFLGGPGTYEELLKVFLDAGKNKKKEIGKLLSK